MINGEKYREEILNNYSKGFSVINHHIDDCESIACESCLFSNSKNDDGYLTCINRKVKWLLSECKEPVKLTRSEYSLLRHVYKLDYKYIARDKNGDISLYLDEPDKDLLTEFWHGKEYEFTLFNSLFRFVKWEDSEPTSIEGVLKNCEVVNDDL